MPTPFRSCPHQRLPSVIAPATLRCGSAVEPPGRTAVVAGAFVIVERVDALIRSETPVDPESLADPPAPLERLVPG